MSIKEKLKRYGNDAEEEYWLDITNEVMSVIDRKFADSIEKIEVLFNIYKEQDYVVAEEDYGEMMEILKKNHGVQNDRREVRITLKAGGVITAWNSEWGGVKFQ